MTSLQSSVPSPGRISWRKDLSAVARDPNSQYLRVRHVVIRGTDITPKPSAHVVYKIDVVTESNNWFVYKRYSQFYQLHFKLHKKFGLSWDLLPRKLVSGNLDPKNITERKRLLEHYLQKLINSDISIAICDELLHFLDVYNHDVVYVTRFLSSFLFRHGDAILSERQLFQLSPTEVYCIGKRLKLPVETSPSDVCDSSQDLGHLFSFVHQLHDLMIAPRPDIGHFGNVAFDLSVFKSLSYLVVKDIDLSLMEGLQNLQGQILDLRCHQCVSSLDDVLVNPVSTPVVSGPPPPRADLWRVEMTARLVQNKLVIQPWHFLERLDLSHNRITCVTQTLHLLPSLHFLSLAHNRLSQLDLHIFSFISLRRVNVSHNTINLIYRSKAPLLSVTYLNISHNQLQNLDGTDCLPNLSELNFSHNLVHTLSEVDKMLALAKLSQFSFSDNPISSQKNARVSIAAKFYIHNKPIILDGNVISEKEKYKIMSNISRYGSNVQNWPQAVSHVSVPSVVAPYWSGEQRDNHRSLSYSLSNNLLLEDPRYEVRWSHFSSPSPRSDSPSISSSAISTPVDSVCSPSRLTLDSPMEDVFLYAESPAPQERSPEPDRPQIGLENPIQPSPSPPAFLSTLADNPDLDVAELLDASSRSHGELELSHTPVPSGSRTPTDSEPNSDSEELTVVSKLALVHALALLGSDDPDGSCLEETELTPKSSCQWLTSEGVVAAIHGLSLTDSAPGGSESPGETCTMRQVLLEDKIGQAIDSLLESLGEKELRINLSSRQDSNQLRPHAIATVINEQVMAEL